MRDHPAVKYLQEYKCEILPKDSSPKSFVLPRATGNGGNQELIAFLGGVEGNHAKYTLRVDIIHGIPTSPWFREGDFDITELMSEPWYDITPELANQIKGKITHSQFHNLGLDEIVLQSQHRIKLVQRVLSYFRSTPYC